MLRPRVVTLTLEALDVVGQREPGLLRAQQLVASRVALPLQLLEPCRQLGFRRLRRVAALALLGGATFAKGPVAPVLFALTLGGFLAWQRELRRLPRLVTAPGLAAFAVLGLGWYATALAGWGPLFVHEHLAGRYLRNLAGGLATGGAYSPKPLAYHLLFYPKHLPAIALPWTPFAALALWRAWRTGGFRDPRLRFLACWAAAPVVAFTPAEWKLRYYLLPSLPALALVSAPAVLRVVALPARRLSPRGLVALAAIAAAGLGALALAARLLPLSPSDRSTLDALLRIAPGGRSGAVAGVGFLAGVLLVALAWRAWAALVTVVAAAMLLWMAAGQVALEAAVSRRDSLAPFARAAAARYPPPARLAFWGESIRPVAVYVGRPMPTLRRSEQLAPGLALVGSEPAMRALSDSGVVGYPMFSAEGRLGNVARGRVILLEIVTGRTIGARLRSRGRAAVTHRALTCTMRP
jgi:4-amino-4-deoxy-L-arabinose transferase-like glycosyltransferase